MRGVMVLMLTFACAGETQGVDAGRDARLDSLAVDAPHVDAAPVLLNPAVRALLEPLRLTAEFVVPPDPTNRFADDRVAAEFGQLLFFDPGFSGPLIDGDNDGSETTLGRRGETGRVACAGCHISPSFVDTRSLHGQISLAAGWVLRRTPTLLDAGHSESLGWGGRHNTFFGQFFAPLESPQEMNSSRLFLARYVFEHFRETYAGLFGPMPAMDQTDRFPPLAAEHTGCVLRPRELPECHGMPGDGAEYDGMSEPDQRAVDTVVTNIGKSMGAYIRRLSCGPGAFDSWLAGDETAISEQAKRGALLFVGEGLCIQCHTGPLLSDFLFHNVGLAPVAVAVAFIDRDDDGAFSDLTALAADRFNSAGPFSDAPEARAVPSPEPATRGSFKTPSLRCISEHPSFMHTGQLRSVRETLQFHNRGGHPAGYPGENELQPLGLSDAQLDELEAFLAALEGPGPETALLTPPSMHE